MNEAGMNEAGVNEAGVNEAGVNEAGDSGPHLCYLPDGTPLVPIWMLAAQAQIGLRRVPEPPLPDRPQLSDQPPLPVRPQLSDQPPPPDKSPADLFL